MMTEFLQYLGEGPDFSAYAYELCVIASLAAADIEEVIELKDGLFWNVVTACFAMTGVMMVLYLFKVTNM